MEFDRNRYHIALVYVPLEAMTTMKSRIRGIDYNYLNYTMTAFKRGVYDSLVGLITVTILSDDMAEDASRGDSRSPIVTPPDSNDQQTLH